MVVDRSYIVPGEAFVVESGNMMGLEAGGVLAVYGKVWCTSAAVRLLHMYIEDCATITSYHDKVHGAV